MPNLYPTFSPLAISTPTESTQFKKSVYFDFQKGDLMLEGDGKLKIANETEAWQQWCAKTVATERYYFQAYSDNYGVELENVMSGGNRAAKENTIARTITDALMADPSRRTAAVAEFNFKWSSDSVQVDFIATAVDGEKAALNIKVS